MVRIAITRFKFYSESEEFNFEPNTLILLRSPSGTGKSTIFEAIYWCLYSSHKKVCPRGMQVTLKNPTIVQITFDNGMVITRTKPPDTLEVSNFNGTNKSLHDEHAQYYIDNLFGTKMGFLATSYMRQGCNNPLLELSNAEKVTLLQELTFGRGLEDDTINNPKVYASKVEEHIKKVKADILILEGKVSGLEECYTTQKKSARPYSKTWKEVYEQSPTAEQITELMTNHTEAENELNKQKKELIKVRKKWTDYNTFVADKTRLEQDKILSQAKVDALLYTDTQLKNQEAWLDLSGKKTTHEQELKTLILSDDITTFLDTYSKDLNVYRKEIVLHKEYFKMVKAAGLEVNDSLASKIDIETAKINAQLKQEEDETAINAKYNLELKTYHLQKKDRENWNKAMETIKKNNILLEEAKAKYLAYFDSADVNTLLQVAGIQEENKSNKDILNTYYNPKNNFASLTDKLKEKLHVVKVATTVLTCPGCEQKLTLAESKLIKYVQPEDYTQINELIRKSLKIISNIEDNLREFHNRKKAVLEMEEEEPPEVGDMPVAPVKVETLSAQNKANLIKRLKVLQSLQAPTLKILPELLQIYTLDKIEYYLTKENTYEEYKKLHKLVSNLVLEEEPIKGINKKDIQKYLTENKVAITQLKQANIKLQELQIVDQPETKIEDIENAIVEAEAKIKKGFQLIEAGKRLIELAKLEKEVDISKTKITEYTQRHVNLNRLKQIISDTGSQALEKTINGINVMLKGITKVLFDNETNIEISMFKEMKTKDYMKNQVNVKIMRGSGEDALEYEMADLSGGEKSRLNLALTIALSDANSSEFLFLDESLSSLNLALQEKCMLLIKDYCSDKIVVNINHSGVDFPHEEVITLVEEDI